MYEWESEDPQGKKVVKGTIKYYDSWEVVVSCRCIYDEK